MSSAAEQRVENDESGLSDAGSSPEVPPDSDNTSILSGSDSSMSPTVSDDDEDDDDDVDEAEAEDEEQDENDAASCTAEPDESQSAERRKYSLRNRSKYSDPSSNGKETERARAEGNSAEACQQTSAGDGTRSTKRAATTATAAATTALPPPTGTQSYFAGIANQSFATSVTNAFQQPIANASCTPSGLQSQYAMYPPPPPPPGSAAANKEPFTRSRAAKLRASLAIQSQLQGTGSAGAGGGGGGCGVGGPMATHANRMPTPSSVGNPGGYFAGGGGQHPSYIVNPYMQRNPMDLKAAQAQAQAAAMQFGAPRFLGAPSPSFQHAGAPAAAAAVPFSMEDVSQFWSPNPPADLAGLPLFPTALQQGPLHHHQHHHHHAHQHHLGGGGGGVGGGAHHPAAAAAQFHATFPSPHSLPHTPISVPGALGGGGVGGSGMILGTPPTISSSSAGGGGPVLPHARIPICSNGNAKTTGAGSSIAAAAHSTTQPTTRSSARRANHGKSGGGHKGGGRESGSMSKAERRRNKASVRERKRVVSLNDAFLNLKRAMPFVPPDTKLSKIKTLRFAIRYVKRLMDTLNEAGEKPGGQLGHFDGDRLDNVFDPSECFGSYGAPFDDFDLEMEFNTSSHPSLPDVPITINDSDLES